MRASGQLSDERRNAKCIHAILRVGAKSESPLISSTPILIKGTNMRMVSSTLREVGLRLKDRLLYSILICSPTERSEGGRNRKIKDFSISESENTYYRNSESMIDRSPGTVCVEQPGLEGIVSSQSVVSVEEALAREFFSLTVNYAWEEMLGIN